MRAAEKLVTHQNAAKTASALAAAAAAAAAATAAAAAADAAHAAAASDADAATTAANGPAAAASLLSARAPAPRSGPGSLAEWQLQWAQKRDAAAAAATTAAAQAQAQVEAERAAEAEADATSASTSAMTQSKRLGDTNGVNNAVGNGNNSESRSSWKGRTHPALLLGSSNSAAIVTNNSNANASARNDNNSSRSTSLSDAPAAGGQTSSTSLLSVSKVGVPLALGLLGPSLPPHLAEGARFVAPSSSSLLSASANAGDAGCNGNGSLGVTVNDGAAAADAAAVAANTSAAAAAARGGQSPGQKQRSLRSTQKRQTHTPGTIPEIETGVVANNADASARAAPSSPNLSVSNVRVLYPQLRVIVQNQQFHLHLPEEDNGSPFFTHTDAENGDASSNAGSSSARQLQTVRSSGLLYPSARAPSQSHSRTHNLSHSQRQSRHHSDSAVDASAGTATQALTWLQRQANRPPPGYAHGHSAAAVHGHVEFLEPSCHDAFSNTINDSNSNNNSNNNNIISAVPRTAPAAPTAVAGAVPVPASSAVSVQVQTVPGLANGSIAATLLSVDPRALVSAVTVVAAPPAAQPYVLQPSAHGSNRGDNAKTEADTAAVDAEAGTEAESAAVLTSRLPQPPAAGAIGSGLGLTVKVATVTNPHYVLRGVPTTTANNNNNNNTTNNNNSINSFNTRVGSNVSSHVSASSGVLGLTDAPPDVILMSSAPLPMTTSVSVGLSAPTPVCATVAAANGGYGSGSSSSRGSTRHTHGGDCAASGDRAASGDIAPTVAALSARPRCDAAAGGSGGASRGASGSPAPSLSPSRHALLRTLRPPPPASATSAVAVPVGSNSPAAAVTAQSGSPSASAGLTVGPAALAVTVGPGRGLRVIDYSNVESRVGALVLEPARRRNAELDAAMQNGSGATNAGPANNNHTNSSVSRGRTPRVQYTQSRSQALSVLPSAAVVEYEDPMFALVPPPDPSQAPRPHSPRCASLRRPKSQPNPKPSSAAASDALLYQCDCSQSSPEAAAVRLRASVAAAPAAAAAAAGAIVSDARVLGPYSATEAARALGVATVAVALSPGRSAPVRWPLQPVAELRQERDDIASASVALKTDAANATPADAASAAATDDESAAANGAAVSSVKWTDLFAHDCPPPSLSSLSPPLPPATAASAHFVSPLSLRPAPVSPPARPHPPVPLSAAAALALSPTRPSAAPVVTNGAGAGSVAAVAAAAGTATRVRTLSTGVIAATAPATAVVAAAANSPSPHHHHRVHPAPGYGAVAGADLSAGPVFDARLRKTALGAHRELATAVPPSAAAAAATAGLQAAAAVSAAATAPLVTRAAFAVVEAEAARSAFASSAGAGGGELSASNSMAALSGLLGSLGIRTGADGRDGEATAADADTVDNAIANLAATTAPALAGSGFHHGYTAALVQQRARGSNACRQFAPTAGTRRNATAAAMRGVATAGPGKNASSILSGNYNSAGTLRRFKYLEQSKHLRLADSEAQLLSQSHSHAQSQSQQSQPQASLLASMGASALASTYTATGNSYTYNIAGLTKFYNASALQSQHASTDSLTGGLPGLPQSSSPDSGSGAGNAAATTSLAFAGSTSSGRTLSQTHDPASHGQAHGHGGGGVPRVAAAACGPLQAFARAQAQAQLSLDLAARRAREISRAAAAAGGHALSPRAQATAAAAAATAAASAAAATTDAMTLKRGGKSGRNSVVSTGAADEQFTGSPMGPAGTDGAGVNTPPLTAHAWERRRGSTGTTGPAGSTGTDYYTDGAVGSASGRGSVSGAFSPQFAGSRPVPWVDVSSPTAASALTPAPAGLNSSASAHGGATNAAPGSGRASVSGGVAFSRRSSVATAGHNSPRHGSTANTNTHFVSGNPAAGGVEASLMRRGSPGPGHGHGPLGAGAAGLARSQSPAHAHGHTVGHYSSNSSSSAAGVNTDGPSTGWHDALGSAAGNTLEAARAAALQALVTAPEPVYDRFVKSPRARHATPAPVLG